MHEGSRAAELTLHGQPVRIEVGGADGDAITELKITVLRAPPISRGVVVAMRRDFDSALPSRAGETHLRLSQVGSAHRGAWRTGGEPAAPLSGSPSRHRPWQLPAGSAASWLDMIVLLTMRSSSAQRLAARHVTRMG